MEGFEFFGFNNFLPGYFDILFGSYTFSEFAQ